MAKEWLFVLMLFRRQRDGLEFGNIEAFDPYEQSGVLRIEDWSELRGGERRNRECRQPFKRRDIGAGVVEEVSSRESLFFFFLVLFFKIRNSRILLLKCGLGPESVKVKVLVAWLCPTLCDPGDCSLPGSSVHGILQGRLLGVGC